MKNENFYIYAIFENNEIVYIGRTKMKLSDRLRGHFFGKQFYKRLFIQNLDKVEYFECLTESDMYVFEVYLINLIKPKYNRDDKSRYELTIKLDVPEFKLYDTHLFDKWKKELKVVNK